MRTTLLLAAAGVLALLGGRGPAPGYDSPLALLLVLAGIAGVAYLLRGRSRYR